MHKYPELLFVFYFPFFQNKSFFKTTFAKHQANLGFILQFQLFIMSKHYIE